MDLIEQRIINTIEDNRNVIIDFANDIYCHGELTFHEFQTSEKVASLFKKLGFEIQEKLAITGVKATIGNSGPSVSIIAELDGIKCPTHPLSNKENGISHSCGHHAQLATLIGAAIALNNETILNELDGSVTFFAVPAEEYVDVSIKDELREQGKIKFGSGKSELIRLGEFDDIDVALTTHVHMVDCDKDILVGNNASNGFISKKIKVIGKASHAAISPHEGINALNAAVHGLNAIGLIRETFKEEDYVRVHSVIQHGGGAVNVIPEEVMIETIVRAKSLSAIEDASNKVDRAFQYSANALGAEAIVYNYQGYLPVIETPAADVVLGAVKLLEEEITFESIHLGYQNVASTDVGDLTHVKPVINFTHGGFKGNLHSENFEIVDENLAYIIPAKIMALTVYHLLRNGAAEARKVMKEYKSIFTKEEYIDYINKVIN